MSACAVENGAVSIQSMIAIPSASLEYRTRGAKPASAAAFMQAKTRAGSFLSSIRVMIRKRYGDPRTTMRSTRSELRHRVILRISSIDLVPKASSRPRHTAALFSCGIMSLIVLRYFDHKQGFEAGNTRL